MQRRLHSCVNSIDAFHCCHDQISTVTIKSGLTCPYRYTMISARSKYPCPSPRTEWWSRFRVWPTCSPAVFSLSVSTLPQSTLQYSNFLRLPTLGANPNGCECGQNATNSGNEVWRHTSRAGGKKWSSSTGQRLGLALSEQRHDECTGSRCLWCLPSCYLRQSMRLHQMRSQRRFRSNDRRIQCERFQSERLDQCLLQAEELVVVSVITSVKTTTASPEKVRRM